MPDDTKAAVIAGELRSDQAFIKSLGGEELRTRVCIKSDTVIVATVRAYGEKGVDLIYSNDAGLWAVALRCGISASDLPTIEDMAPLAAPPKAAAPKAPTRPDKKPDRGLYDDDDPADQESGATPPKSAE